MESTYMSALKLSKKLDSKDGVEKSFFKRCKDIRIELDNKLLSEEELNVSADELTFHEGGHLFSF